MNQPCGTKRSGSSIKMGRCLDGCRDCHILYNRRCSFHMAAYALSHSGSVLRGFSFLLLALSSAACLPTTRKTQLPEKPKHPQINREFKVTVLPDQQEILKSGQYGLTDFPDGLMGILEQKGIYYFFMGSFAPKDRERTHLFRLMGKDPSQIVPDELDDQGQAIPVLSPSEAPAFDDHISGNGSLYFDAKSNRIYFWYQAMRSLDEEIVERKRKVIGEKGIVYPAYSSIGLAISEDLGKAGSWKTRLPTMELNLSWEEFVKTDSIGIADSLPPVVVKDRKEESLYLFYVDYHKPKEYQPMKWQLAVAKLPLKDLEKLPQPWLKYDGKDFSEPAAGGSFSPIIDNIAFLDISYNTYLDSWIMIYNSEDHVLSLRTSQNLIHWSNPREIYRDSDPKHHHMAPTIVSRGGKMRETDQEFWIYYGFSPDARGGQGYWLARRQVHIE